MNWKICANKSMDIKRNSNVFLLLSFQIEYSFARTLMCKQWNAELIEFKIRKEKYIYTNHTSTNTLLNKLNYKLLP